MLAESTHSQPTTLLNRLRSRSCTRAFDTCEAIPSLTPNMTLQSEMTTENLNPEPDAVFKMLKDLLNQDIKLGMEVLYQTLEKMVTKKPHTMLNT